MSEASAAFIVGDLDAEREAIARLIENEEGFGVPFFEMDFNKDAVDFLKLLENIAAAVRSRKGVGAYRRLDIELTSASLREQALQRELDSYQEFFKGMLHLIPCTCESCDYFGCEGCVRCTADIKCA